MAQKRVLVVEDEGTVRSAIRDGLEQFGYETAGAEDGPGALATAEVFHPDVILLDIVLPGFDGYEACRRLKANPMTAHVPVIFLTGAEDERGFELASAVGAIACIAKPCHLVALVEIIRGALARRKGHGGPKGRGGGEGP